MITSSTFSHNGNLDYSYGGAMLIKNSEASLINNTCVNNTAIHGGAISFQCTSMTLWNLNMNHNVFEGNTATQDGGVIYYDYNRPVIKNSIFINNHALYGQNIASYPVKIGINDSSFDHMSFTNVGSGVVYDKVTFVLLDYDNQTMVLNNQDYIKINPSNFSQSSVLGTNHGQLTNGIASFSNLILQHQPGASNITFVASSKAIDKNKIESVFGSPISDNTIDVSFRWCKPGEIYDNINSCVQWSAGTYSFTWNSTTCDTWFENTLWLGGTETRVESGYWRKTHNSTVVRKCLNPNACRGGYEENSTNPTIWAEGYEGDLCTLWTIKNGIKYQRLGQYRWSKCPDPIVNSIITVGSATLAFLFYMTLIALNIKKRKDNTIYVM